MRVLVTEAGIHDADGNELAKGVEITIKDDELPVHFVNKVQILPEGGKKPKGGTLIVNPKHAELDDLKKQAAELGIDGADAMDAEALQAAIDAKLAA